MNTDLQARPSARVVLVNWKNAPLTLRAARSIVPQLRVGDRLVIVDNGSEDDSLAVLDAHLPELLTGLRRSESGDGAATDIPIELVNAGVNGGFGAGVTAGAAGLSEDALVLLNNDATVREGFLDALLAPLGTPDVGATTALILLAGRYRHAREDEAQALSGNGPTRWVRQTDEETMQSEGTVLVNSTGNIVDRAGNGQDRDWLCEAKDLDAAPDVFGLCGGACAIRRRRLGESRRHPHRPVHVLRGHRPVLPAPRSRIPCPFRARGRRRPRARRLLGRNLTHVHPRQRA